jgi:hypothetical protein
MGERSFLCAVADTTRELVFYPTALADAMVANLHWVLSTIKEV